MKIDTSTTAGKIAVMQAFEDGKIIQAYYSDGCDWLDCDKIHPSWKWTEFNYRIKPQTVEEAAVEYASEFSETGVEHEFFTIKNKAFKEGAQWQKDQDNE